MSSLAKSAMKTSHVYPEDLGRSGMPSAQKPLQVHALAPPSSRLVFCKRRFRSEETETRHIASTRSIDQSMPSNESGGGV